jgi:hypothetical protein
MKLKARVEKMEKAFSVENASDEFDKSAFDDFFDPKKWGESLGPVIARITKAEKGEYYRKWQKKGFKNTKDVIKDLLDSISKSGNRGLPKPITTREP